MWDQTWDSLEHNLDRIYIIHVFLTMNLLKVLIWLILMLEKDLSCIPWLVFIFHALFQRKITLYISMKKISIFITYRQPKDAQFQVTIIFFNTKVQMCKFWYICNSSFCIWGVISLVSITCYISSNSHYLNIVILDGSMYLLFSHSFKPLYVAFPLYSHMNHGDPSTLIFYHETMMSMKS